MNKCKVRVCGDETLGSKGIRVSRTERSTARVKENQWYAMMVAADSGRREKMDTKGEQRQVRFQSKIQSGIVDGGGSTRCIRYTVVMRARERRESGRAGRNMLVSEAAETVILFEEGSGERRRLGSWRITITRGPLCRGGRGRSRGRGGEGETDKGNRERASFRARAVSYPIWSPRRIVLSTGGRAATAGFLRGRLVAVLVHVRRRGGRCGGGVGEKGESTCGAVARDIVCGIVCRVGALYHCGERRTGETVYTKACIRRRVGRSWGETVALFRLGGEVGNEGGQCEGKVCGSLAGGCECECAGVVVAGKGNGAGWWCRGLLCVREGVCAPRAAAFWESAGVLCDDDRRAIVGSCGIGGKGAGECWGWGEVYCRGWIGGL
jgi:hypothetical protein